MDVKGVMASVSFDGEWITIVKRQAGSVDRATRINVRSISGTTMKPGTRLFHGYIQFAVPGSTQAAEAKGLTLGGRPPHSDPHSLSIPRSSNEAATKLVAAVEEARTRLSP